MISQQDLFCNDSRYISILLRNNSLARFYSAAIPVHWDLTQQLSLYVTITLQQFPDYLCNNPCPLGSHSTTFFKLRLLCTIPRLSLQQSLSIGILLSNCFFKLRLLCNNSQTISATIPVHRDLTQQLSPYVTITLQQFTCAILLCDNSQSILAIPSPYDCTVYRSLSI